MINQVILIGRLTKDPEIKQAGEHKVANFTLAVENRKTKEKTTNFINCQVWNMRAEALCNYTRKGSLLGVEGSIQVRNYKDKDDKTVYVTEVLVDQLTFLESKDKSQSNGSDIRDNDEYQKQEPIYSAQQTKPSQHEYSPTKQSSNAYEPKKEEYGQRDILNMNIEDEDLPF